MLLNSGNAEVGNTGCWIHRSLAVKVWFSCLWILVNIITSICLCATEKSPAQQSSPCGQCLRLMQTLQPAFDFRVLFLFLMLPHSKYIKSTKLFDIFERHLSTMLKSIVCFKQMSHSFPEERAKKTKAVKQKTTLHRLCWEAEKCTPAVRQHQSVEKPVSFMVSSPQRWFTAKQFWGLPFVKLDFPLWST